MFSVVVMVSYNAIHYFSTISYCLQKTLDLTHDRILLQLLVPVTRIILMMLTFLAQLTWLIQIAALAGQYPIFDDLGLFLCISCQPLFGFYFVAFFMLFVLPE